MILTGETGVLGEKHYTAWVVGEWMGMEHWWNDTDRGNWSTGRKTLYSVGGRWMNGYGALVEWYWQGKLKYWQKNTVPVPFRPPQTSHGLAWDRTLVTTVTARRPSTWPWHGQQNNSECWISQFYDNVSTDWLYTALNYTWWSDNNQHPFTQQFRSFFQSEISVQCTPVLPLSISSILS